MQLNYFGYCRTNNKYQKISVQKNKILNKYKNIKIYMDEYNTSIGKKNAWKNLNNLKNKIKNNDILIINSILILGDSLEEILNNYQFFLDLNVEIIFLKESYLNSKFYYQFFKDTKGNYELQFLKEQILELLNRQNQKNTLISKNTSRALKEKKIGRKNNVKIETKKSKESKIIIKSLSKSFDGVFLDSEILQVLKINRNTYYKYKREIKEELKNKKIKQKSKIETTAFISEFFNNLFSKAKKNNE